ncbi:LysR family transcriptional regulator [Paenibacillaceae bacterium]|nr:LysR family transcriptional regulator [Paenibacillaceae bacterium]
MELRQLEYFTTICEELHFTKAAERLGITQPTLSHQIKALEDEIGTPLFDRIGKKIAITEAGMILHKKCSKVFNLLSSAREEINELQQMERGSLSIGALPGELNHLASTLLVDFHKSYPSIRIKLFSGEDIMERVLSNELQLGISILPLEEERIRIIPLYSETFYFVCTAEHPLADKEKVNFADAVKLPTIMFPQTHHCRQLLDVNCKTIGYRLQPLIETTSIESLFYLVRESAGATILSRTLLQLHDTQDLTIIPIENPVLCRDVGIIVHKDKYLGKAASAFIELLTSYIARTLASDEEK